MSPLGQLLIMALQLIYYAWNLLGFWTKGNSRIHFIVKSRRQASDVNSGYYGSGDSGYYGSGDSDWNSWYWNSWDYGSGDWYWDSWYYGSDEYGSGEVVYKKDDDGLNLKMVFVVIEVVVGIIVIGVIVCCIYQESLLNEFSLIVQQLNCYSLANLKRLRSRANHLQ